MELNKTFICLIPKTKNPAQITYYRPISFCNIIYKTITKIIVNRIRSFLDNIISPQQYSFIPGRHVVDNTIIVQEAIHSFQKTKGKFGKMLLKIDLEKDLDKLEINYKKRSIVEQSPYRKI